MKQQFFFQLNNDSNVFDICIAKYGAPCNSAYEAERSFKPNFGTRTLS